MSKIVIDTISANDVEPVVTLLNAQLLEHDLATAEDALREVVRTVLGDARHGFILLARSDARAVGVAYAAAHLSAEHAGVIGWLEELYVVPDCRGRGIGAALLEKVMARAEKLKWRGIELEVVAGHERAAALYVRHGFAAVPRSRYTLLFR